MLEMSYCHEKGIPHSEWLSWSAMDRAKILAYSLESAERCTLCGTASWEWDEDQFAYEVEERFCKGCYMKEVTQDSAHAMPGTTVELIPSTELTRARNELAWRARQGLDMSD